MVVVSETDVPCRGGGGGGGWIMKADRVWWCQRQPCACLPRHATWEMEKSVFFTHARTHDAADGGAQLVRAAVRHGHLLPATIVLWGEMVGESIEWSGL